MKKKTILFIIGFIFIFLSKNVYAATPSVTYTSHVQDIGWQNYVSDGINSGTTGQAKRLEGIKIKIINSEYSGNIEYRTHIQDIGWQGYVTNNNMSGTTGRALRLEAIQIKLTGEIAEHYDVYYRVHAENYGWLGWAKNDEKAGTSALGLRLEAIQIKLVEKNTGEETGNSYITKQDTVSYSSHVENVGWQNNTTSGTSGIIGNRIEAIKINLSTQYDGNIEYTTLVQNKGWQTWTKNGLTSGTTGQALEIEAIKIKLTGDVANYYDIYYRVYITKKGWLGWAKNAEIAGSINESKRIEGIQIKLVKKDTGEETGNSYSSGGDSIKYSTHISNIGWKNYASNGVSGYTSGDNQIEALRMYLESQYEGNVLYESHIQNIGWESTYRSNGNISGTTGKAYRVESLRIKLTGEISNYYDVYYRVYSKTFGWLGWAKNGEDAGTTNLLEKLQAIEVKLVEKGTGEETGKSTMSREILTYSAHVSSVGWQNYVSEGMSAGTVGRSLQMEAIKINIESKDSDYKKIEGNVLYKICDENGDWSEDWISNNEIAGSVGKSIGLSLIKIKLDGELANYYDIYYRVHSEQYGWLGWAKNGQSAGATYYDIQAIEIKLRFKENQSFDLPTANHYIETGFYKDSNGYMHYKDKNGKEANDWIIINGIKYFFNSKGIMVGKNVKKIIDVSAWQKDINWSKVKNEGSADGAIIRAGVRGYSTGELVTDSYAQTNITNAKEQGLPLGLYVFSQAINTTEAIEEADLAINIAQANGGPSTFKMLVIDTEYSGASGNTGRADNLSKQERTQIAKAFLERVKAAGYTPMIYASKTFLEDNLDMSQLNGYKVWLAQYSHQPTYNGSYVGWQYYSKETIAGVNGYVDMSVWFE